MYDFVRFFCPHCDEQFDVTVSYIQGQIKVMKIGKVGEVAHQMHEKRGPFYDKWLAAMEKRGEQKRCKECLFVERTMTYDEGQSRRCYLKPRNPGHFACSGFYLKC